MKNKDIREYYVYLWKIHFDLEYNLFLLKNYLFFLKKLFSKVLSINSAPNSNTIFIVSKYHYLLGEYYSANKVIF